MKTGQGDERTRTGDTVVALAVTVKQAAAMANCHPETIRRAIKAGHLRGRRFGRRQWRIEVSELKRWLANGAKTAAAA
jgi:excisionase family DNA binding protein